MHRHFSLASKLLNHPRKISIKRKNKVQRSIAMKRNEKGTHLFLSGQKLSFYLTFPCVVSFLTVGCHFDMKKHKICSGCHKCPFALFFIGISSKRMCKYHCKSHQSNWKNLSLVKYLNLHSLRWSLFQLNEELLRECHNC